MGDTETTDTTDNVIMEDEGYIDWEGRWSHIYKYLERPGPLCPPVFEPGEELKEIFHQYVKVLVIGAGGLGCELLKNLALMGFKDIHVIDMDTIDVSNLNRQFLFRHADVGRPKAQVAAEFIMKRVPGCKVTPYYGKIQDKPLEYYTEFPIIICGLDSIEARRWMNATVVSIAKETEQLIPMVDGGTEGFKGQSRVIAPNKSSCYECSLDMLTQKTTFPICTIANTPRLPEHCIEWASVIQWPKHFPGKKIDGDDPEHITWLYDLASKRANEFGIQGVTYSLTQGVVKNIIPAIASTNAVIAASCANEAFKLVTNCAPYLDNYMMYVGDDGVYTYTFQHERKPNCQVCGSESLTMDELDPNMTLEALMEMLMENRQISLKKPSLSTEHSTSLYMQAPPPLEEATRPNLVKPLSALVKDGDGIIVTDANLPISMRVVLKFKK